MKGKGKKEAEGLRIRLNGDQASSRGGSPQVHECIGRFQKVIVILHQRQDWQKEQHESAHEHIIVRGSSRRICMKKA